jgi:hypothetical protein
MDEDGLVARWLTLYLYPLLRIVRSLQVTDPPPGPSSPPISSSLALQRHSQTRVYLTGNEMFFCTCFCQQTRVYLTGIEQFCLLTPMNYTTNTRDNLFVHQNGTRRNPQYMTIKGICHILVNDVSNARFNHFLGICL